MDLPETRMLNFFNKVLIFLFELTPDDEPCSIATLITHCQSVALGGQGYNYERVIEYCHYCGLIQIKEDHTSLSSLGHKFLSANKERYFDLKEAQKQIIIEKLIFNGPWNPHARKIFNFFSLNASNSTYQLSTVDVPLSVEQNIVIHFFQYLGLLKVENHLISVDGKYTEFIFQLTADRRTLTEQQLEKILVENKKLGAQAENVVLAFEKERLKQLGKFAQAELVKRISVTNSIAGYDIESFDGDSDDIFPNRLIEVKASSVNKIRFYWSINEIEVAKKENNRYWIYMIKDFKEDGKNNYPIMIQNPAYSIEKHSFLNMESTKFLINEVSDVVMSEHSLGQLKWYKVR